MEGGAAQGQRAWEKAAGRLCLYARTAAHPLALPTAEQFTRPRTCAPAAGRAALALTGLRSRPQLRRAGPSTPQISAGRTHDPDPHAAVRMHTPIVNLRPCLSAVSSVGGWHPLDCPFCSKSSSSSETRVPVSPLAFLPLPFSLSCCGTPRYVQLHAELECAAQRPGRGRLIPLRS